jgi:hypothetical protein
MLHRALTRVRKATTVLALLFGAVSAFFTPIAVILTLLGVESISANRTGSARLPVDWQTTGIFALMAMASLGLAWLINPWQKPRKDEPPAQ